MTEQRVGKIDQVQVTAGRGGARLRAVGSGGRRGEGTGRGRAQRSVQTHGPTPRRGGGRRCRVDRGPGGWPSHTLPGAASYPLTGVRGGVDGGQRPGLHRGVPDQPADPGRRSLTRCPSRLHWHRYRCRRLPIGHSRQGPDLASRIRLRNEQHQIWPNQIGFPGPDRLRDRAAGGAPCVHHLSGAADRQSRPADYLVRCDGQDLPRRDGPHAAVQHDLRLQRNVSRGLRINAEYGKPVLVRFEDHLDENPLGLDRQDFGAPDIAFLTHLHNAHTAPESDGNPHYSMTRSGRDTRVTYRGCSSIICT